MSGKTQAPNTKDMVKITMSLTIVCLISAAILGALYTYTEPIKLKNLAQREIDTIKNLLELPGDAKIEEVKRFANEKQEAVYLTPKFLVRFDENATMAEKIEVPMEIEKQGAEEQDKWVMEKMKAQPLGRFFIGKVGSDIKGYVVEGATNGYKNKIRFFVAIDGTFTIKGVEVLEQEEDPGLGGEISQKYLKNQFAGRTPDMMMQTKVTKDPLDGEWKKALESLGVTPYSSWIGQNQANIQKYPNIFAITGATISSEAMTNGVRKTLLNFQKRVSLLGGLL